jgi:hypothetical protein
VLLQQITTSLATEMQFELGLKNPSGIKQKFLSAMNYYYHHYQSVITLQYFDRPQSRVANSRLVLIDFNALELLQRREAIFFIKSFFRQMHARALRSRARVRSAMSADW